MTLRTGGSDLNIAAGIREFGASSPGAIAVSDGERNLTYGAVDDRSNRLAQHLLASGVTPGDAVAVLLGNRLEYPEIAAGLAKAGMPMVPVNPRLTAGEVAYILEHSGARALVLDDAHAGVAGALDLPLTLSVGGTTLGPAYEEALADARATDPCTPVRETDPFCIAYTSGTTGRPKGVLISHRSRCLTFYATALEWGLGPGKRTIAVAPMYHGAGFAFAYAALFTGGSLSMMRAFDPERLLTMIAADRPDSVFLVPTHAQMLRALGEDAITRTDTSSLSTLYFNAAPFPQALKTWVLDALPHVGVHELYGSTEAGIVSNLRPADQRRKVSCVGPPWFMTEVRVIDSAGQPAEPGQPGELYSRSPFLMNGYLNDAEATDACTTEDGFLTSGDIVRRDDDGYIYIVDRVKDLVISGGSNVYPREVEEVLMAHPAVADAAVIGTPDETWGEAVTAVLVPRQRAADLDLAAVEAHCRRSLAGFKVPRLWRTVDTLPRNAAGKVLKTELRAALGATSDLYPAIPD